MTTTRESYNLAISLLTLLEEDEPKQEEVDAVLNDVEDTGGFCGALAGICHILIEQLASIYEIKKSDVVEWLGAELAVANMVEGPDAG